ncbi:acyltransferase, partial [Streptosporangium algeriense]
AMPVPGWAVVVTVVIFYVLMALVALGALGWLRWRGLVLLGALTYPLYLFHSTVAAVLVPMLRDTLPPWLTAVVTVLVTLVLSYLVHRLVERPVQEFVKARRRRPAVRQGRHGRGPARGAVPAPEVPGEKASEKASVP